MANTTNFNWETPDDTDLVKDGALAIRTLGNSIDTTLVDLKGGTTGQVLSKTSNTDMDFTWITASSGSLKKITNGTFSNVSTADIDNVFSTTYDVYMAVIRLYAATGSDDAQLQFRYGTTTTTAGYYGSAFEYNRSNTLTTSGYNNSNQATLSSACGDGTSSGLYLTLYFNQVGVSSNQPAFWGQGLVNGNSQAANVIAGTAYDATARTFTGFRLKSSSTNITGNYVIYGLEK